jgi:hypothetical protein
VPWAKAEDRRRWERASQKRKRDRHLVASHVRDSKTREERRPSPYQRGAFVAIDGEGCYRRRAHVGPQLYALLSASDGATPASVWNEGGLSTVDCLEFLLSLPRRYGPSIFVGFGLTYDVSHWLRDLGSSRWTRLYRYKSVWAGPYNVEWVPKKWLKVSRCPEGSHVHRRGCFRQENGGTFVKVEDVFSNFNASFEETVAKWLPNTATPALGEGKGRRDRFVLADRPFMERYNDEENRLLVGVIRHLWEARIKLGIRRPGFYSPAVISVDLLQRLKAKDHIGAYPEELVPALYGAYFGGRIECAQIGRANRPIFSGDLNSAYPAQIADLPDLHDGTCVRGDRYRRDRPWSLYRVRYDLPATRADGTPRRFYPFPHRSRNGGVVFPRCGTTWVWEPEVRAALECGGFPDGSIEVLDAWHFLPNDPDARPFERFREFYQWRTELKESDPPAADVLKLGLNGAAGKFAQQVAFVRNKPPPYRDMGFAGLIWSGTRALLYRMIRWFGEENVVAIATDGVFLTCPLEQPKLDLSPYRNGRPAVYIPPEPGELPPVVLWNIGPGRDHSRDVLLFRSGGLGQLKFETYLDMTSLGSGIYRLLRADGTWEVHARGYGGKQFPWDDVERAWARREEMLTYVLPRRRFVGPRLALALGRFERWNEWETVSKTIRLSEAGSKRTSLPRARTWRSGDTPAHRLFPTKPDSAGRLPTDESFPYRGKQPNDQAETAEELTVYEEI